MFPISDSPKTARFAFVNITLIILTVLVFFQQITSTDQDIFILQYALIPANVQLLNITSLMPFFTAIFLHGGFLHIASNMWFLWIFGDNVEVRLGTVSFVLIYFLSGVVGNLAQYFLMPNSPIPMLGASGAVAGILGAYYVFFPNAKIKTFIPIFGIFPAIIEVSAIFMLGYWFILQLILGTASLPVSSDGGIAFWAHVGGFVTGVLYAKFSS